MHSKLKIVEGMHDFIYALAFFLFSDFDVLKCRELFRSPIEIDWQPLTSRQ